MFLWFAECGWDGVQSIYIPPYAPKTTWCSLCFWVIGCYGGFSAIVAVGALVSCSLCPNGTWAIIGARNTATTCAPCPLGVLCVTTNGYISINYAIGYTGQMVPSFDSVGVSATGGMT